MAQAPARPPRVHRSLSQGFLSTASCCRRAALACIPAAPVLLRSAPPCHPIGEASVAIVGRAGGADRSATDSLPWAALAMHPAAPLLLAHRPSHHPIGEAVCAIVWVSRRSWRDGHHWRHNRPWHWSDRLGASDMVDPAAPCFLVGLPHGWRVHCAIVGVDWACRPWRRCRPRRWRCWWRCGRRGWRRCRRRSGARSSWCLGGATDSASAAAILLLLWRPHHRCCRDRGSD